MNHTKDHINCPECFNHQLKDQICFEEQKQKSERELKIVIIISTLLAFIIAALILNR